MSDLFDEIFELGFEYAFESSLNVGDVPSPSLPSTSTSQVIDLTCGEEIDNIQVKTRKAISRQESQREYYQVVIDFLRRGGDPNFVYVDDSCPFLGPYYPRYRGRNLLQTCVSNYRMTKLLLKCGADLFQKDERGHNSYDYCRDPKIKDYIAKLLRR